jgi:hypothetical protein
MSDAEEAALSVRRELHQRTDGACADYVIGVDVVAVQRVWPVVAAEELPVLDDAARVIVDASPTTWSAHRWANAAPRAEMGMALHSDM